MGEVIGRWMVFSVVVCHVGRAFVPVKPELALSGSAPEPKDAHPDHFDAPLDDGVMDKSNSG